MSRIGTSSQSAQHMATLFQEMRAKEARNYLAPHLKHLRSHKRSARAGDIRKRDLQALACHWKLNKIPGFWTENSTEDALLSSLYRHAKKLEEAARPKERLQKEKRKVSVVVQEVTEDDIDWQQTLKDVGSTLPPYKGDLFGTRGDYNGGLIYASRRPAATQQDTSRFAQKATHSAADNERDSKDSQAEDTKQAGKSAQSSALEQLKINSTAMLHQLSKQSAHKKDLASAEAVEAVFRMWRNSPNEQVRRNCAMTLANLFTTTSMERDDVLTPILQLAKDSVDPAVQATVAKALLTRVLTERPLGLGYVPEVISAVRTMKARCVGTTKRDVAQVLRLLLERGRRRRRQSAAAKEADERKGGESKGEQEGDMSTRVLEVAANEGILSLLASLATDPDDSERQEHCSAAMLDLTNLPALHNDMSGRSVLPVVVSLLQSPSPQTCDNAALIMFELVCSPDQMVSSKLVNNEDVTSALLSVAIAQAGVLTDPEQGDDTERTMEQVLHMGERATAAILTLSCDPLLLSNMVNAGVADALFAWFNFGNDHIKHNCVMALCNLFACVEGQAALVELGFVRVIIAAANIKPLPEKKDDAGFDNDEENYADPDVDVGVRKRCSRALCMLSSGGSDLADHLIEENAVEALVRLTETLDHDVRLNCVQALMHLSKWPVSHPAMIQYGAIKALTKFSNSKDPEVLEAVTLSLCNLANSEDSHHALLEEEVITTLVRLAGATGLRQQCVSAFCQLSAFRPAHDAIINQGVLPMLIAQSRFTNAHIRRECAQALYNLSCMVGSEAQEVAHGVPAALTIVALFRADDGLTKDLCAAALFNLMYDPAGRQQLLDDGVLWAFIKLALAAGTKPRVAADGEAPQKADTAETCTRLIRNLSCDDEMARHTIEKRTLAALSKFAPSANPTTRLNCGITLCEITRRQHLHNAAVDRGIVSVVHKLANVRGDVDVAECCATVLFRLTQKTETRDKLAAEEAIPSILIALLRTAIGETVALAGRSSRGAAPGEDEAAFNEAVTAGKKRVRELKRTLAVVATNLSGHRTECPALVANGMLGFMNLLCRSAGPVTAVPPNATETDARIDCPLADPVSINAVVRTLYNLTAEQECCALLAATTAGETTNTLSHVLGAVAADESKAVYDDETAEMAVVSMVNLSAQAKLVAALHNLKDLNSVIAVAKARQSVHGREACAVALTNIIVGACHADPELKEETSILGPILGLWDESSHGETQHHATLDAYCFLFWFLARRQAALHSLLDHGLLTSLQHVVHALTRRSDKSVTDRERDALMLETAIIIQTVSADEKVRGVIFEGAGEGVATLVELTNNTAPLIQRSVSQSFENLTHSHALRARVIQHEGIVPFMANLANKQRADKQAQALCATALKNLSDDPTLAQLKPAGNDTSSGVVASVLRLLPPPTAEPPLGTMPPSADESKERGGVAELSGDAVEEGTGTGSFVRGHGRALNAYPQNWRGVIALPVATVPQDGVTCVATGEPDWEKIVDLEGVPKPLEVAPAEPSPSPSAGAGMRESKSGGGAGPETRDGLPGSLQQQAFPPQKSPRSILPPIDSPASAAGSSKHPPTSPIRTGYVSPEDQPYAGIGAGKKVAGVSQGLRDSRRRGADIQAGKDGSYTHGKPSLPRVSGASGGRKQQESTGKRASPAAGDAEEGLWGTQGSRMSNSGSLPKLPKSPAQGARRTTPKRRKGRKAKSPYGR